MMSNTINDAVTMQPGAKTVLGRIDKYELVRELGEGGFGTVYLARDTVANTDVAIKGLPPEVKHNKSELEGIRENFALVKRLRHPNIVAVTDLHQASAVSYASKEVEAKLRVFPQDTMVVMDYAPGVTLAKWRRQFPDGKVPIDIAVSVVRQVASALDYAHGQKVLHRDVKPANIIVETSADGNRTARILDFGLAAEIRSSMGRLSREIRDTSGTRPYMAPEQWLGHRQGPATDQYALAVIFYELVGGEVPFASVFDCGDPAVMRLAVTTDEPDVPSSHPKEVRNALAKALAKKPEERFASCVEFVDALEGKVKVSRRGAETRSSGSGIWKTLGVLALLAALAGGGWFYYKHQERLREQERLVAEQKAEAERLAREAKEAAERQAKEAADRQAKEAAALQAKEAAERQAKEAAARQAEEAAARQAKEAAERKAKEESDHKNGKPSELAEKEALLRNSRRQQLYRDLAHVETSLEMFAKFEHQAVIQAKRDSLSASYKAARTAFEKDDIENAMAMVETIKEPCEELRKLIPVIREYYSSKSVVESERASANEAEATLYAEVEFSAAEKTYEAALRAESNGDYPAANAEIAKLVGRYAQIRDLATANPEFMYRKGLAAQNSKDNNAAFVWFSKAAAKDHAAALVSLGLCYKNGVGTGKNDIEAFGCFRRAAFLNHARAQYLLGGCYAKAIGTKYDKEQSRQWMIMAKVNGDKAATDFLSKSGWRVSADEESAVKEILETGRSDRRISSALRQIAEECNNRARNK